ncbi:uncharacterized protein LOC143287568 [Babylonia areolata]|uniref:uncharacterized protein LOC143287568 n=1 Tax=Babylonia areolata TaxID=304850 RepID=UPI003FD69E89
MATGGSNGSSSGRDHPQGDHHTHYTLTQNVAQQVVKVSHIKTDDVAISGPIVLLLHPANMRTRRKPKQPIHDEALDDLPVPEDLSPLFKPEDLDRVAEEKMFVPVAKAADQFCRWRWLSRKLDTDSATLSKLCMWYENHVEEMVYQLLLAWKKRNSVVKVRELVTALCDSFNQTLAKALLSYFEVKEKQKEYEEDEKEKDETE